MPTTERTTGPWRDAYGRASVKAGQTLLLLGLATALVYALTQLRLLVIPMLLALILAAAIAPLVHWLRRRGWPSAVATGFSFLLLLLGLGGLVTAIVFAVMGQADELVRSARQGFDQAYEFARNGPVAFDDQQIQQARDAVLEFATSSAAGAGVLSGLGVAGAFMTGTLLTVVILFFFLKDGEKIWAFILRAFKGTRLVKARRVGRVSLQVLGGYVRGTAIVATVDAFFIGLALVLIGVPLALPLAAIVFIGAFIPLVGATLAGVLAALVALVSNGPFTALIVVVVVIIVNQLEGDFLQPVVMGHTLSVHALVILLALTGGTILAGIIGAILSVPLTAVTWAAIKAWIGEPDGQITDEDVLKAERETVLDERGQSRSTTPAPAPERERQEDEVAVDLAKAQDRDAVNSRADVTDPREET